MTITEKYISKEYREGRLAHMHGLSILTNPYGVRENGIPRSNEGPRNQEKDWECGWQDNLATEVRDIKETIKAAAYMRQKTANGRVN